MSHAPVLLCAAVGLAACRPSPAPPVPLAGAFQALRGPAGDVGPPSPGRCPRDAAWNGHLCLGQGYVACPGDARFDDAGACQAPPRQGRDAGGGT